MARREGNVMNTLTRRNMLTGAAAAGAATALTSIHTIPVHAAAPLAGTQAPGWYRMKVGTSEVTVISEGARISPLPDNFVRNKTK